MRSERSLPHGPRGLARGILAFTLVEVLVVTAVIGVCAGLGIAAMSDALANARARDSALRFVIDLRRIRSDNMRRDLYTVVTPQPQGGGTLVTFAGQRFGSGTATPCQVVMGGTTPDSGVLQRMYEGLDISMTTDDGSATAVSSVCFTPVGQPFSPDLLTMLPVVIDVNDTSASGTGSSDATVQVSGNGFIETPFDSTVNDGAMDTGLHLSYDPMATVSEPPTTYVVETAGPSYEDTTGTIFNPGETSPPPPACGGACGASCGAACGAACGSCGGGACGGSPPPACGGSPPPACGGSPPPACGGSPPPACGGSPPPACGGSPPPACGGSPPPACGGSCGAPPPPACGGSCGAPPPPACGGSCGAPPPPACGGSCGAPPPACGGSCGAPPPPACGGSCGAPPPPACGGSCGGSCGAPPPPSCGGSCGGSCGSCGGGCGCGGGGCFTRGTPVVTADGPRAIESVEVGDQVWAGESGDGERSLFAVTRVYTRTVSELVLLTVDGNVVETTAEHPFWVDGVGFTRAGDLVPGDILRGLSGSARVIESVSRLPGTFEVHNFEVEHAHTYFVTDMALLVHNMKEMQQMYPR